MAYAVYVCRYCAGSVWSKSNCLLFTLTVEPPEGLQLFAFWRAAPVIGGAKLGTENGTNNMGVALGAATATGTAATTAGGADTWADTVWTGAGTGTPTLLSRTVPHCCWTTPVASCTIVGCTVALVAAAHTLLADARQRHDMLLVSIGCRCCCWCVSCCGCWDGTPATNVGCNCWGCCNCCCWCTGIVRTVLPDTGYRRCGYGMARTPDVTRVARIGAPGLHSLHCRLLLELADWLVMVVVAGAEAVVVAATRRGFQTAQGYTPTRL